MSVPVKEFFWYLTKLWKLRLTFFRTAHGSIQHQGAWPHKSGRWTRICWNHPNCSYRTTDFSALKQLVTLHAVGRLRTLQNVFCQEERSVIMLSCLCGMLTSLLFVIIVYCLRDCSVRRVCQCMCSTSAHQCCCCCCQVTASSLLLSPHHCM